VNGPNHSETVPPDMADDAHTLAEQVALMTAMRELYHLFGGNPDERQGGKMPVLKLNGAVERGPARPAPDVNEPGALHVGAVSSLNRVRYLFGDPVPISGRGRFAARWIVAVEGEGEAAGRIPQIAVVLITVMDESAPKYPQTYGFTFNVTARPGEVWAAQRVAAAIQADNDRASAAQEVPQP
jgi:hypothetical protein